MPICPVPDVQCIDCVRLDLRRAPSMARHGYGNCERKPNHEFVSVDIARECDAHLLAPDSIADKRLAWLAKLDQPRQKAA